MFPCCNAASYNTTSDIPKTIKIDASNLPNEIKISSPPVPIINLTVPLFGTFATTQLKEGCTVEGGSSGQTFTSEYIDLETDFVSLRCTLKGLPHTEVYTPLNVEAYCTGCGAKKTRNADNFCGVCGKKF